MNITYTMVGNVQIPNLVLDPSPNVSAGKHVKMRKCFLEQRDNALTLRFRAFLWRYRPLSKSHFRVLPTTLSDNAFSSTDPITWMRSGFLS